MAHPSKNDVSREEQPEYSATVHTDPSFDPVPRWEAGYGSLGVHGHWSDTSFEALPTVDLASPLETPMAVGCSPAHAPHELSSWWIQFKAWIHDDIL